MNSVSKAQSNIVSMVLITAVTIGIITSTYYWGVPLINKAKTSSELNQFQGVLKDLEASIEDVASTGNQKSISLTLDGTLKINEEDNSIDYIFESDKALISSEVFVSLNDEYPYTKKIYGIKAGSLYPDKVSVPECGQSCYLNSTCLSGKLQMNDCNISISGTYIKKDYTFNEGELFKCNRYGKEKEFTVHNVNCSNGFLVIAAPDTLKYGIIGKNKAGVLMARSSPTSTKFINEYKMIFREMDDLTTKNGNLIKLKIKGSPYVSGGNHKVLISKGDVYSENKPSQIGGDLTVTEINIQLI